MENKNSQQKRFMKRAAKLALYAVENDLGGPFGAVVVKEGKIIGEGYNRVISTNDPTAHAEIIAIRNACKHLESFQLTGCEIYSSCEPCPMCLGAIYWARPARLYFGTRRQEAADAGFDDAFIYNEMTLSMENRKIPVIFLPVSDALSAFQIWKIKGNKIEY